MQMSLYNLQYNIIVHLFKTFNNMDVEWQAVWWSKVRQCETWPCFYTLLIDRWHSKVMPTSKHVNAFISNMTHTALIHTLNSQHAACLIANIRAAQKQRQRNYKKRSADEPPTRLQLNHRQTLSMVLSVCVDSMQTKSSSSDYNAEIATLVQTRHITSE